MNILAVGRRVTEPLRSHLRGQDAEQCIDLSAPLIYRLQLDTSSKTDCTESFSSLREKAWLEILHMTIPHGREFFLEGYESLSHPGILALLDVLERCNCTYHLQSRASWANPHQTLDKLQRLRGLSTLRILPPTPSNIPGGPENRLPSVLENIRMAVASGLNVCVLLTLGDRPTADIGKTATRICELGIRGVSFILQNKRQGVPHHELPGIIESLRALEDAGFLVNIEGCATFTMGSAGGAFPDGTLASCYVDAFGNVKVCRHSAVIVGNLLKESIKDIWAKSSFRRFNCGVPHQDLVHPLGELSEISCPFDGETHLQPCQGGGKQVKPPAIEEPIGLDSELCPVRLFETYPEQWGAILIRGRRIIPIWNPAVRIVNFLDGRHTLRYLSDEFGPESLSFVYGLFACGLVRFARNILPANSGAVGCSDLPAPPRTETPTGRITSADQGQHFTCNNLPPETTVVPSPELHFFHRGPEVLVVEPESASWLVLNERQWIVFRRMGAEDTKGWPAAKGVNHTPDEVPQALAEIRHADQLSKQEFFDLVRLLFQHNMIAVKGSCFYEPTVLWHVERYPHYYNLHMTEACNLACMYCRVYSPKSAPLMTPETCRLIVRRVLEEIPVRSVTIGFHGGEPMLNPSAVEAGAREANDIASRLNRDVRLFMQTNGTLFSQKKVTLLKELNIKVGVSLDGPQEIHDRQRVFHSGRGSHAHVMRGLRAALDGGLDVGYLAVIHDPTTYVHVLDYLVRDLGARSVRMNYSAFEGRGKHQLGFPVDRAEQFAHEWLKMVDYADAYHRETGIWLDISDLNLFITHLITKERPHMCYRSPCGIGNSILGFDSSGRIYPCDELVGNSRFQIGDIHDGTNLKELLDDSTLKHSMMADRQVENISKCLRCPWRRLHGSGCTNKTYECYGTLSKNDPMCRFYCIVFEELIWRLHKSPELANLCGHYSQALKGRLRPPSI